jgi:hypothetical protein
MLHLIQAIRIQHWWRVTCAQYQLALRVARGSKRRAAAVTAAKQQCAARVLQAWYRRIAARANMVIRFKARAKMVRLVYIIIVHKILYFITLEFISKYSERCNQLLASFMYD